LFVCFSVESNLPFLKGVREEEGGEGGYDLITILMIYIITKRDEESQDIVQPERKVDDHQPAERYSDRE